MSAKLRAICATVCGVAVVLSAAVANQSPADARNGFSFGGSSGFRAPAYRAPARPSFNYSMRRPAIAPRVTVQKRTITQARPEKYVGIDTRNGPAYFRRTPSGLLAVDRDTASRLRSGNLPSTAQTYSTDLKFAMPPAGPQVATQRSTQAALAPRVLTDRPQGLGGRDLMPPKLVNEPRVVSRSPQALITRNAVTGQPQATIVKPRVLTRSEQGAVQPPVKVGVLGGTTTGLAQQSVETREQRLRRFKLDARRADAVAAEADVVTENRKADAIKTIGEAIPGVGAVVGVREAIREARAGDWQAAAGDVVGAVPFGGILRSGKTVIGAATAKFITRGPLQQEASTATRSALARSIADGHAFNKHVLEQKEFPGISNQQQFAAHIEDTLNRSSHYRPLARGRSAYYNERTNTLIILDPRSADAGTAFKIDPSRYPDPFMYFNGLQ